ncbi:MAG: DUF3467 domain-containing protein [Planctomycetia bacterium]|nr:DUF3467 domain-containing protein [Planctomycetia bacterium]
MNDEAPADSVPGSPRPGGGNTFHQEVQHSPATARVPDPVGRGVFSTHAIVMQGAHEFLIDFIQSLAPPRRVVSRIVLPNTVVPLFVGALEDNLRKYAQVYGPPPRLAPQQQVSGAPPAPPPPIAEVYEQLKLPDDMLGGNYANTVVISHSQAEFCFDFICNFYPRSVVTSRVYLAAPHVSEVFDSLQRCLEQYRQKLIQSRSALPPQPEPQNPHADENHNGPAVPGPE